MAKKDTSVATANVPELVKDEYKALAVPAAKLAAILKDSVGTQGLKVSDLDKIKVPTGGMTVWEVPTLDGSEPMKAVEGIVLHFKDTRGYWASKAGGNKPPDCRSDDGLTGIGTIAAMHGGNCATCPMAQFGTAVDDAGKPAAGQACKQKRIMLFLRQENIMPLLVSLPATSLKNARQYFLRLVNNGLSFRHVTTQLRLEKKQGPKNEYSVATLTRGRNLEPEELAKVETIGKAMREMFSQATVIDADPADGE